MRKIRLFFFLINKVSLLEGDDGKILLFYILFCMVSFLIFIREFMGIQNNKVFIVDF